VTGVLILAATAVVYALLCLGRPHHTCWHCHGKRVTRNSKGRRSKCKACKGTGIKVRPGARLVHGFYQHVKGEPDRAGRMQRINRVQVEAEHERQQERIDDARERAAAAARSDNERLEP
jgi:hypothetical protein